MIHFDHIEPPVVPDQNPNRSPPMPPAPAPDVVPVRDPVRPEHPGPVKEPPSREPPISMAMRPEAQRRLRARGASITCRGNGRSKMNNARFEGAPTR